MNNMTEVADFSFKILFLGDTDVGKSCFLLRYTDETFTEDHITTIGIYLVIKELTIRSKF